MRDRDRTETEARERYPDKRADEAVGVNDLRSAFIAGRTVTTEQVEEMAKTMCKLVTGWTDYWEDEWIDNKRDWIMNQEIALEIAGLLIEADD